MKIRELVIICCISFIVASCDTTRTLYTSSKSKKNYWTIKAYTMSHCGCTELYVETFEKGKHISQIEYMNGGAIKRIFNYNDQGKIAETIVLRAITSDSSIPFDSLDNQMFQQLKKIIENGEGIVYEVKWMDYKGYTIK